MGINQNVPSKQSPQSPAPLQPLSSFVPLAPWKIPEWKKKQFDQQMINLYLISASCSQFLLHPSIHSSLPRPAARVLCSPWGCPGSPHLLQRLPPRPPRARLLPRPGRTLTWRTWCQCWCGSAASGTKPWTSLTGPGCCSLGLADRRRHTWWSGSEVRAFVSLVARWDFHHFEKKNVISTLTKAENFNRLLMFWRRASNLQSVLV